MKYSNKEIEAGFKSFCDLVKANPDKIYELTMPYGDVIEVVFDMSFEDDSSSTADTINTQDDMDYFYTLAFVIRKVVDNITNKYKVDNVVLVNYRNMPNSYKMLDK